MGQIENLGQAMSVVKIAIPDIEIKARGGLGYALELKGDGYYMMFKRQYYQSFNYHFPNVVKANGKKYGYAQVMNLELLKKLVVEGIEFILCVMLDGKIYRCKSKVWLDFYLNNKTDAPHLHGEVGLPLDFFTRVGEEKQATFKG